MNHPGTLSLTTPRLLLRRYRVQDAADMYRNWASDAEVTRYLPWPPHKSSAVTQRLLQDWCARYDDPDYFHWVIQHKASGHPIGDIAVCALNIAAESASVGYCLGRPWWGQGLMTEALDAVLDFLFEDVGLACVSAGHDVRNAASGRVMQKCGLRYRCTLPAGHPDSNSEEEEIWYAITQKEYAAWRQHHGTHSIHDDSLAPL